jgi:uncharacterized membrane protein
MSKAKTRPPRREDAETSPSRWPAALLSAAGFVLAAYLGVTQLAGGSALFCTAGSGCDVVQASRYAVILGVPTALWGAALFAAIGGVALAGLSPQRWLIAFLLAAAAASFSLYLTYLELFVLRAVCAYCLASAAIAVALFGVLLWQRPRSGGRRSPARPARVVALGSVAAVAAVVIGAGIFAWESPQEAAIYQNALARHLAASGAVMYGAYW